MKKGEFFSHERLLKMTINFKEIFVFFARIKDCIFQIF